MAIRQRLVHKELNLRGADFSPCELYRYTLYRRWSYRPPLVFCMLNPSTADVLKNDPTVERCERRARRLGYGSVIVVNIFAFRATLPKDMYAAVDPIGPDNDIAIEAVFRHAKALKGRVVAAWGSHGKFRNRASEIQAIANKVGIQLYALGLTKDGLPRHPLYIENEAPLLPWSNDNVITAKVA